MSTPFPHSTPTGESGQPCVHCGRNIPAGHLIPGVAVQCPACGQTQTPPAGSSLPDSSPAASTGESKPAPPAGTGGDNYMAQPPGQAAAAVNQPAGKPAQAVDLFAGMDGGQDKSSEEPVVEVSGASSATPATGMGSIGSGQSAVDENSVSGRVRKMFDAIKAEISKVFIGQDELVLGTLVALFSSGHVLIESVPGLGKTLFVRTLGKVLGCEFGRIQFTADLMPSDISGAPVFDMKEQEFRFRPGPVFTQFLLADEINRAPAKTHAALLEIMQEYRVTVDGVSHPLTRPFLVLATQNPVESEGTYNLPEAQLDRFMFKLIADYPVEAEEARILEMHSLQVSVDSMLEELKTVASPEKILEVTRDIASVRIDARLVDYINKVVRLTRQWPQFHMGASPRAGIALMQAARTLACFSGRDYAVPDDVVEIALPALRHRVILTAEAEVEGYKVDDLLRDMIRTVEVPRL